MPLWRSVARRVPGMPWTVAVARRLRARRWQVREALLDYPATPIRVRVTSAEVARARLHPTAKEPWTVAWLESRATRGEVLWDIGANIGAYALIAASRGAQVVAVEPGFASYATLCDNILLNGMAERVVPLSVLLADRTRIERFGYRDPRAGAALHAVGVEGPTALTELAYRLDELVDAFGLPAPTLVKLDVDGLEAKVLAGAERTLAHPRLRSVLVEVAREDEDVVIARLAAGGLALVERVDERDGAPLSGIWYGIFERS